MKKLICKSNKNCDIINVIFFYKKELNESMETNSYLIKIK